MLCQELVHNYNRHLDKKRRCAIKVDLMKAYDSINWNFLLYVLRGLGFPEKMVRWIEVCFTTPRFSLAINGESCGFFLEFKRFEARGSLVPISFCYCYGGPFKNLIKNG